MQGKGGAPVSAGEPGEFAALLPDPRPMRIVYVKDWPAQYGTHAVRRPMNPDGPSPWRQHPPLPTECRASRLGWVNRGD